LYPFAAALTAASLAGGDVPAIAHDGDLSNGVLFPIPGRRSPV
jgi:hypothetical protein